MSANECMKCINSRPTRHLPQPISIDDARVRVALDAVKLELQDVRSALKETQVLANDVKYLRAELAELKAARDQQMTNQITLLQVQDEVNGALQEHLAPVLEELRNMASTMSAGSAASVSTHSASEQRIMNLITSRSATVLSAQTSASESLASFESGVRIQIGQVDTSLQKKVKAIQATQMTLFSQIRDQMKEQAVSLENRLLGRIILLEGNSAAAHDRTEAQIDNLASGAFFGRKALADEVTRQKPFDASQGPRRMVLAEHQAYTPNELDALRQDLTPSASAARATAATETYEGSADNSDSRRETAAADYAAVSTIPASSSTQKDDSCHLAGERSGALSGSAQDSGGEALGTSPPSRQVRATRQLPVADTSTAAQAPRRAYRDRGTTGNPSTIPSAPTDVNAHSSRLLRTGQITIAKRSNKRRISVSEVSSDDDAHRSSTKAKSGLSQSIHVAVKERVDPIYQTAPSGKTVKALGIDSLSQILRHRIDPLQADMSLSNVDHPAPTRTATTSDSARMSEPSVPSWHAETSSGSEPDTAD